MDRDAVPGVSAIATLEILGDRRRKWAPFCEALKSFPGTVHLRHTVRGDADILAVWGACGHHQWQAVQQYRDRKVICMDVGYFRRESRYGGQQQIKVALNDPHPEYLPDAPPDRFDRLALKLTDVSDPNGPVIVAGLGVKSRQWLYGHTKPTWEKSAIAQYPGRNVIYRPKGKRGETLPGVQSINRHQADIVKVLTGASRVVSRHSNVCHVDAPLLGIPIVVETGPSRYLMSHDNTVEVRRDYLRRLAWWSWSLDELRRGEHWEWVLSH